MSFISQLNSSNSYSQAREESSGFRSGYGDFILVSSDGVRFHIDRSLLAHVSGFFKDLFSLPQIPVSATGSPQEASLAVKEASAILDAFLRHIDPNKSNPDISTSTIAEILETARFYRVPTIMLWFGDEVLVKRKRFRSKDDGPCFLEEHPLFVLVLAYKFGLSSLTQLAISELITCKAELWREGIDVATDGRLVLYCKNLRDERIELYSDMVASLTQHELSKAKNIKDHRTETCMSCTVARAKWTHKITNTSTSHPEWAAVLAAYKEEVSPYACQCEETISWPEHKGKVFQKWVNVNQPERLEGKVPFIPGWLDQQLRENASLAP